MAPPNKKIISKITIGNLRTYFEDETSIDPKTLKKKDWEDLAELVELNTDERSILSCAVTTWAGRNPSE